MVADVLHLDEPPPAVDAFQTPHVMPVAEADARLAGEVADQQVGERAIIDVGPGDDAGRGDRLVRGAPFIVSGAHCPISAWLSEYSMP